MVAIIIDVFLVLNFFNLFSNIYLNNISSKIGPIIPDDNIDIYSGIRLLLLGGIILNINIFNKQDIDIPNDIRG